MKTLGVIAAAVVTLFATGARAEEDAERRLVLMVQYVGSDYRGAVPEAGKVANQAEYEESVQTVKEALALYRRLKANGRKLASLQHLEELVRHRESPEAVEVWTRGLVVSLRQELKVEPGPLYWPDLALGQRTFLTTCATCHGVQGRGDGAGAVALNPKPPDMTSSSWADHRSPFQLFNTVTLGIPGTAMQSFEKTLDHDTRWALAFYLLTLRPKVDSPVRRRWFGVIELAEFSNLQLVERQDVTGVSEKDGLAFADAARRQEPPTLSVAQAMQRMKQAVLVGQRLVAEGRRADASDVVAQTYYDAVEPAEPAMMKCEPQDLPEMETKVTAVRNAISGTGPVDEEVRSAVAVFDRIASKYPDLERASFGVPPLQPIERDHVDEGHGTATGTAPPPAFVVLFIVVAALGATLVAMRVVRRDRRG